MEHEFYECPEYLSNTHAEMEKTEEYEFEVEFCTLNELFNMFLYSFIHQFLSLIIFNSLQTISLCA